MFICKLFVQVFTQTFGIHENIANSHKKCYCAKGRWAGLSVSKAFSLKVHSLTHTHTAASSDKVYGDHSFSMRHW